MFARFSQFVARHRLPIPVRYFPFLIIAVVALMLLSAAVFGVHLFDKSKNAAPKATRTDVVQMTLELRAHAFAEVAALETSAFRHGLESFRHAAAQDQREAALRLAKEARAQALHHLAEAEAIALPTDRRPNVAALRVEIAELDRQLAAMPGTQGN